MPAVELPETEALERDVAELMAQWRVPDTGVRVRWNKRLRTCAGRAFHRDGRIELNPHLLQRAPEQLRTVLVHEAAHVACCRMFGARVPPHGRHWRALMRLAGLPPDITHEIPVDGLRRRRWLYLRLCDACGSRTIGGSVRYQSCRCGRRDRFLVMRATAGPAGRAALRALTATDMRRRCRTAGA
jgi:predicted SprT family Zn-dependent metalloprotease